ncbi:MAG: DUF4982 domain-containing protein [Chlorobi bacterium]|nr:DUF4982 domain-containing protein [Chlorobiota bacterium]
MKNLLTPIAALLLLIVSTNLSAQRTTSQFTKDWKFLLLKDGQSDEGFYKKDIDDSSWRTLDLPHDWGVEGEFDLNLENNTGLLPWKGIGWYRKEFTVPASDEGRKIFIQFDGAMANSRIWCNGELVGGWPYGYSSFQMDLTPYINYGGENVIAVKLDTKNWDSRWYPGAGLYRSVRLVKTSPVYVGYNGVYVTTPDFNDEKAFISVQTDVLNSTGRAKDVEVDLKFYRLDADDNRSGTTFNAKPVSVTIPAGGEHTFRLDAEIERPLLWSVEEPNRYGVEVLVKQDGKVVDSYFQPFGIRKIVFTPRDGFYLNGKRVQIKGVCNHHDLGPLGSAFYAEAAKRQLVKLKEMGANAIRTSHNPPSPELLDLCDKLGFLVEDEAFDAWRKGKRKNDYNRDFEAWNFEDLKAMVKRDRNHPSVVIWSTGNEVPDQRTNHLGYSLYNVVKEFDATRPVSYGCNWGGAGTSGFEKGSDIFGLNYNHRNYKKILDYPDNKNRGMIASETSSCISSRGIYFFPVKFGKINDQKDIQSDFQVTSYDNTYPGWGCTPDRQFEQLAKFPEVYGEFVWTGFDYIGEPTPYNKDMTNLLNYQDPKMKAKLKKELEELGKIEVPSRSSYFGIMDLCGFRKDRFYNYQAHWRPELPMAHILPHWNWPDRKGKVTPVHVYTSGDEAELFLNGKSLGRKKKGEYEYRLIWDNVKYQPGTLKVVAYKDGKEWATDEVQTTGKAKKIKLTKETYPVNGKSILYFVTVDLLDSKDRFVPTATNDLSFNLEGEGEIIATGNGDPTCLISFKKTERPAFSGKCLVIVKMPEERKGKSVLKVKGKGLTTKSVEL